MQKAFREQWDLLVPAKTRVVLAVSGGADSLAMLHLARGQNVVVGHVEHGIRPEAKQEAQFVKEIAESWGLKCMVMAVDVPAFSRTHKYSLEESARILRYQQLAEIAQQVGATHIATAHHADDQAETVLMHLWRGTGLTGLRGMLPSSPLPNHPHLTLVRPLLALSREQIEAYCEQHSLTPMQDASNFDTTFLRNRIRHEFMPAFSSHNPQFKDNLTQLATIVQADEAVLENATKTAFAAILVENNNANIKFDLVKWRQLAVGLQRRVLRMALTTLQPNFTEIGFRTIELARAVANGQVGGKASLPTGLVLRVGYDFIVIGQQSPDLPTLQLTNASPLPLALPGVTAIGNGWEIEASWEKMPASFPQNPLIVYLHLPESTPLFVRPRQAGERFQPLGMGGKSVTLKKAMINWKMPASSRALHPIVATPNHVVWVVGQQIDERVKVDTQEFLWRLTCKKTVTLSSE